MSGVKWWTTPRRIIQPIFRVNDGQVDGRKMVDELHAIGCNTILQNAGGMVAWHPTKVPYHHTPPGMKGDLLGDVIDQAHRRDIKVMVRYDLSGLRRDAFDDHPEWFYVSSRGEPMIDKGFFATCPSGSYYRDFFHPIFDELCGRYTIDGIFFNMFGYRDRDRRGVYLGPCHCDACKAAFARMHDLRLPERENWEDPAYYKYLEFRERMYLKQAREVYDYIKTKSQDIGVFEGRGTRAPMGLLQGHADATEVETHWTIVNRRPSAGVAAAREFFPGGLWRYTPGETCRMVRTMGGGFSSTINIFQAGGGRFEAHSRGWMGTALAQAVANGGWPYVAFVGEPWLEDRKTRKLITELFTFLRDNEGCFRELTSTAQVAIVGSQANAVRRLGRRDAPELSQMAYRGWYNVLVRAHIEFDVLEETQIERSQEVLDRYDLVILPNQALMSDAACRALDAWVSRGGQLVATYQTSLFDERGTPRPDFGLASLGAGPVVAQRELFNAFLRNPADPVLPSLKETGLIIVNGGYVYATPRPGARGCLSLTGEIEYASPEQEVIETETAWPGVLWQSFGQGRTAYLPWEIDRLAYQYGLEDHVALMEDVIRECAGGRLRLEVEAPSWVEATLHRQEGSRRWILQLVNESGQDGVEFRDPAPIHDVRVRLEAPEATSARSLWRKAPIKTAHPRDRWIELSVPVLELYDLIVVE